ncbi:MAG: hypothetical protein HC796_05845 [Synechococcaceae cyanobacterium RL_1_2]|nr:hypothetical protein [Synechococcaceae cyanobacterium RL_1_2]
MINLLRLDWLRLYLPYGDRGAGFCWGAMQNQYLGMGEWMPAHTNLKNYHYRSNFILVFNYCSYFIAPIFFPLLRKLEHV